MPNLTVNTQNILLDLTVNNSGFTLTEGDVLTLTMNPPSNITLEIPAIPAIELALDVAQGPSGVIGSDYTVRFEQISSTQFYRAEAESGSAESSNVWRVHKITVTGSTVDIKWAGGSSAFDKNWTNRSSYTYS